MPTPIPTPTEPTVLVINWRRTYETRFTAPLTGRPITLKPGPNYLTAVDVAALEPHRKSVERLEHAGHLTLEEPATPSSTPARPLGSPAHRSSSAEAEELARLRARVAELEAATAGSDSKPLGGAGTEDAELDADGKALPEWGNGSSYDELKAAARARSIEFTGNTSKAKLLELLEQWEDARLLALRPGDDDDLLDEDDKA